MNILYIGEAAPWSTSRHRADALARLGHEVEIWDPTKPLAWLRRAGAIQKLHIVSGQILLAGVVEKWLARRVALQPRADIVWVNNGEHVSRRAIRSLKALQAPIVLYNNDDPTGPRDGNRFKQLREALPEYDLCVALRKPTADEMLQLGSKGVMVVPFSYDEVEHRPLDSNEAIGDEFRSDIAFVGTWLRGETRDAFLDQLRRAGLRVSVWGPRWNKSRFKGLVKQCWKTPWIYGRDYVHAITGAKITIGLLSKGNRDLHTQRSVEIPYAGGVLCAERTLDHVNMFKDRKEAVFWDSPEECARVCRELLVDEEQRKSIVSAGMQRVRELKVGNEDMCRSVLERFVT